MINDSIKYVGVNDHEIDLFEGQYVVPNGMAYNSYVILDDKIAVLDTVDASFKEEWLTNVEKALDGREPDYLIVQHMEPDHSANVDEFVKKYPNVKIVANAKAFTMMKNFFGTDYADKQIAVADGSTLNLGKHVLSFVTAPMVHWPEVIMTYDQTDKVLFSADAFGKFGALDVDEDWACEARRYYVGIVGKYGVQVQALFKKVAGIDIKTICPLHGPILTENLGYYLNLYNIWSSYGVESEGIAIFYTSVYGNTKKAVEMLASQLEKNGAPKVVVADLSRCDMAEAVEDAFRYSHMVVCAASYDADVFPPMHDFLHHLKLKNYQNSKVAIVENGSWAPTAGRVMRAMLDGMKNISIVEPVVTIRSRMKESDLPAMEQLAAELLA